ncbi:head-tail connector protein [Mangrovicoccus algicola]|uniref:Phage gp6-like head-tail connector protein n=1 Tax=Mangrovicoccus algicola TaxID=2771008 RepID=A0A8J6YZR5_9RHOB|nr:hypothetical protein [Mangrovicoccus algicola]MBE3639739.1 hypothetical protein [Mangrovicoccus algicola]
MRLKEQTGLSAQDLPLAEFRAHLRLGTGFGGEDLQDAVLEAALRAAIASIEARTGKALIARTFIWQACAWRDPGMQALPVAPVISLSWIKLVTRTGEEVAVDPETVVLEPSTQRPVLRSAYGRLPSIPTHGFAEIGFVAGYAESWAALPGDLAQAVMILAAHFYETRLGDSSGEGGFPRGVTRLIERYRTVRILGGSAA